MDQPERRYVLLAHGRSLRLCADRMGDGRRGEVGADLTSQGESRADARHACLSAWDPIIPRRLCHPSILAHLAIHPSLSENLASSPARLFWGGESATWGRIQWALGTGPRTARPNRDGGASTHLISVAMGEMEMYQSRRETHIGSASLFPPAHSGGDGKFNRNCTENIDAATSIPSAWTHCHCLGRPFTGLAAYKDVRCTYALHPITRTSIPWRTDRPSGDGVPPRAWDPTSRLISRIQEAGL